MKQKGLIVIGVFIFIIVIVGGVIFNEVRKGGSGTGVVKTAPRGSVEISIVYAPESDLYLPQVIEEFNSAYENGTDPVTGKRLTSSDKKIFVKGEPGSSGTIHS
ncbi:MAG: hypothetical protein E4H36_09455, partial [Spirochaetales bacterium]